MSRLEYLADVLNEELGYQFNIKAYENNSETDWSDILIDDAIHGVLRVAGGNVSKTGDSIIDSQNITLGLAIPYSDDYKDLITSCEDNLKSLHGNLYAWYDSETEEVDYSSRTDINPSILNGKKYALITFYLTLVVCKNTVMTNDTYVTIGGTELEGIINVIYKSQHQQDSQVLGLSSAVQHNKLAGIGVSLTIDLIIIGDNALHQTLIADSESNNTYTVVWYNGVTSRTFTMTILDWTEFAPKNNILKAQLVLGTK